MKHFIFNISSLTIFYYNIVPESFTCDTSLHL